MITTNLLLILIAVVVAGLSVLSPYLIGQAVDRVSDPGGGFMIVVGAVCVTMLLSPCLKFIVNVYIGVVDRRTRVRLKQTLLSRLCLHHFSKLDGGGHIIAMVDGDVEGALYLHHRVYFDLGLNVALIFLSLLVVVGVNSILIIPPLISLILGVAVCWFAREAPRRAYNDYIDADTRLVGGICDEVMGRHKQHNVSLSEVLDKAFRAHLQSSALNASSSSSYFVGVVALFFIGSMLLIDDVITAGELFSVLMYMDRVLAPAAAVLAIYYSTRESSVRLERIRRYSAVESHD